MNPHPFLALITPIGDTGGGSPPSAAPPGFWGPNDPRPTNPIAGPGRGLGWGMANDPGYGLDINRPYPDHSLPGSQPYPDHTLPPFPSQPIYLPPDAGPDEPRLVSKVVWTPQTGWVVVFVPTGPTPTPSK